MVFFLPSKEIYAFLLFFEYFAICASSGHCTIHYKDAWSLHYDNSINLNNKRFIMKGAKKLNLRSLLISRDIDVVDRRYAICVFFF